MKSNILVPLAFVLAQLTGVSGDPVNAPYDPIASSTFFQPSPPETFSVSYASGEAASGFIANDVTAIGDVSGFAAFGGVEETASQKWPFPDWDGDGIIGFGPAADGTEKSVIWPLFGQDQQDKPLVGSDSPAVKNANVSPGKTNIAGLSSDTPVLGLVMTKAGGDLFLGGAGIPATAHVGPLQELTVPDATDASDTVWQVMLSEIRVGSQLIFQTGNARSAAASPPGPTSRKASVSQDAALLDTGSGCINLPSSIHDSFDASFRSQASSRPDLTFVFAGGATVAIPFDQYVIDNKICVAGGNPFIQLGDPFFRSAAVEFVFGGEGKFKVRVAQSSVSRARDSSPGYAPGSLGGIPVHRRRLSAPPSGSKSEGTRSRSTASTMSVSDSFQRYFIDVTIGSKAQTMSLLVDTGSTILITFSKSPVNVGLILGLVFGGLALLGLGIGAFFFFRRRKMQAAMSRVQT